MNDETNKLIIAQHRLFSLTLSKNFLHMLCHDNNILHTQGNRTINLVSDVNYVLYTVYESCEYVGDVIAPLLQIVHIDDNDGICVTQTYPQSFH